MATKKRKGQDYEEEYASVYVCYGCQEEITFKVSSVRYNLDGTVHLCTDEDKELFRQYCELVRRYYNNDRKLCNGEDFWKWRQDLKAQRQSAYYCYTCSEEVIFHGTRIRYNLDGALHLCKPEDKEAYRQYCEQHKDRDGEDFWKYKRDLDEQRWRQTRDNYSKLLEDQQRKLEEEQKRQAAEEQRHKAGAEEEQRRVAQEQRKRAANEKRRATRERNKRAKEERKRQAAEEQQRHAKGRKARGSSPENQALKVLGLTRDVLRLAYQEKLAAIKHAFRELALKFHPDKGGTCTQFREITEAYEYLRSKVE
ncbi:MAG: DnaJ domain-containing protein [Candidatus Nitrosopolaris sp.]